MALLPNTPWARALLRREMARWLQRIEAEGQLWNIANAEIEVLERGFFGAVTQWRTVVNSAGWTGL